MKVGDLVKLKQSTPISMVAKGIYIVVEVYGSNEKLVCLTGFPTNQVFKASQLEVINESR